MMYFITFLCVLLVFACIIAVAIGITNVIMKWEAKRNEKFYKEWDEKVRRAVLNSLYGMPYDLSKVEDVEYEDVSDVKLLENTYREKK